MYGLVLAFIGVMVMQYGRQQSSDDMVFVGRCLVIVGALVFFAFHGAS